MNQYTSHRSRQRSRFQPVEDSDLVALELHIFLATFRGYAGVASRMLNGRLKKACHWWFIDGR
jgi:hypothetical protein